MAAKRPRDSGLVANGVSSWIFKLTVSQNDDRNDEFLISRIIFLLTYKTTVNLTELIEKHELANSICRVCLRDQLHNG